MYSEVTFIYSAYHSELWKNLKTRRLNMFIFYVRLEENYLHLEMIQTLGTQRC